MAIMMGFRILALAGYDPQQAVTHFSNSVASLHEIQPLYRDTSESLTGKFFKLWRRKTHPSPEQRTASIRAELERWEKEAEKIGVIGV